MPPNPLGLVLGEEEPRGKETACRPERTPFSGRVQNHLGAYGKNNGLSVWPHALCSHSMYVRCKFTSGPGALRWPKQRPQEQNHQQEAAKRCHRKPLVMRDNVRRRDAFASEEGKGRKGESCSWGKEPTQKPANHFRHKPSLQGPLHHNRG